MHVQSTQRHVGGTFALWAIRAVTLGVQKSPSVVSLDAPSCSLPYGAVCVGICDLVCG